jgi:transposase-like protein
LFDRHRTPLTVWFEACWMFASQKDGVSALGLARSLEIGSYQTAWAMLHRLRSVLVRPGRERLSGIVEVDETSMGGVEPGLRGGRAKGKKSLVVIAVEHREPKGFGRCRMEPIDDFSSDTLCRFLVDHVEERSTVVTDGLQSYRPAAKDSYIHQRLIVPGDQAGDLSPGVHRVASLAKRWLLGTHQGAVEPDHLGEYLNVLLRWPEASVTSGGTRCRQWRTGSLEVCVTPPSERFRPAARRISWAARGPALQCRLRPSHRSPFLTSVFSHELKGIDEFVFRFNRRNSRSRGLVFYRVLELAVAHDPVRYRDLVVNPASKSVAPVPPTGRGHPPSLE